MPKIGPLRPSEFSDIRACARQTNLGRHGAVGWNRAGVRRPNTEAEPHRARIQRDDISRYHSRIDAHELTPAFLRLAERSTELTELTVALQECRRCLDRHVRSQQSPALSPAAHAAAASRARSVQAVRCVRPNVIVRECRPRGRHATEGERDAAQATLWVHAFDAPTPRPGRRVGRDERRGCGRRSRLSASTQRRTRRSRATRATSAASAQSRPCIRSRTVRGGDGNDGGRGEMPGAPLRPAPALSTNSCRLCPHPSAHHFFPSRRRRMSSRIGGVARRAS